MSGKGDKPRPLSIPYKEYANRYDAIFGKPLVTEKEENEEPCEDETSPQDD